MSSNEHPDMSGNWSDVPYVCEKCGCRFTDDAKLSGSFFSNARLRELLRELCKSFECYAALNKPEKDWDEYDHMMNPVWQRANKELGQ